MVLLLFAAGFVLFALKGAVAYDFQRYVVLSGFEASRWTWLLVVLSSALALFGMFLRRNILMAAAIASGIAVACVAMAIVLTVRTIPHRVESPSNVVDCSNQNIGLGCRLNNSLDNLAGGPPDAAPSRALLIAALGMNALICAALVIRTTRANRTRS